MASTVARFLTARQAARLDRARSEVVGLLNEAAAAERAGDMALALVKYKAAMVLAMSKLRTELTAVERTRPRDAAGFYVFVTQRILRWTPQVHTHKPPKPDSGDAEEVAVNG
jgi:hypothetical protein